MKVVYVAHRLNGPDREAIEANRARASRWVAWIARTFKVAPVADWIILTGEWDETEENRRLGMQIDLVLVARCEEFWMVGGERSPGMSVEQAEAIELGKPIRDLLWLGEEPPAAVSALDLERLLETMKPMVAKLTMTPRESYGSGSVSGSQAGGLSG